MAGKKKGEIQLQREIETQEEWEECMAREGVWVVDVYQEWCGPCHALVANFRRLKNELGDPLLNYAVAKADTIDALEKYRGRCEPTFLFYAGGILVAFIHGANAPKIQRTITEQLAQEHKVLEGQGERKEVKDNVMTRAAEKEIAAQEAAALEKELEALKYDAVPKGITVAIIKPDALAAGKGDEIIQEIKDKGIEILAEEQRELTEDEAVELYKELEEESYFDELIKFVTSGPCKVLVLTKGDTGQTVLNDWREMIGPTNVEEAKEEAPDSLRAKYGDNGYINALHGSSTKETAARELAFFFPQLTVPTYLKKKENINRTLALIKPEAFSAHKEEILARISEAGFQIALHKEVQLTKDQAAEFYKEHEGQSYFNGLVDHMTSGPILALCMAGDDAIGRWREMLGPADIDDAMETAPNSLRAKFVGPSGINQFHGSDNEDKAKMELDLFFPMQQTVAAIKPTALETKDAIIEKIHEAGFRIAARKETTITREIAEMLYPGQMEKEYFEDLVDSITSGPTMFMVLTREDAVFHWRQCMGHKDPEEAKELNPESLRAQYGLDILNNAVHGSSNPEHANAEIGAIFGNLQFNDDGTLKGQIPELEEASEALKVDRSSPVAETAPEHRDQDGETSAMETTADTTQDITTTDQTQEQTADETQEPTTTDQTQEASADEPSPTEADETTVEETEAETTQGDTTVAETTMEQTADETQVDETQGDTTAGDVTQEATVTDEKTEEPTATDPESTPAETTTAETTSPGESDKPSEEITATQGEGVSQGDDGKIENEEGAKDETKEESVEEKNIPDKEGDNQAKGDGDATTEDQATTEQATTDS